MEKIYDGPAFHYVDIFTEKIYNMHQDGMIA